MQLRDEDGLIADSQSAPDAECDAGHRPENGSSAKTNEGSQNRKRSSGASDELFIERLDGAADAARCGVGHSRILLCGAAGVVVFQPSSLWSAHVSLNVGCLISVGEPTIQQALSTPPVP